MKRALCIILLATLSPAVHAQRRIHQLPQLAGYVTLQCDFHMHTVFSDGDVWPTLRADEAWAEGLDAIAITDHIEFQRKKDYIPTDHNAAWKIIKDYAAFRNVIPIHGTEISRDMPPGHLNALFITDATLLQLEDPLAAVEAAAKQGAFIFYNHPGWKSQQTDGIPRWYGIHETMLTRGWLHGVEFSNGKEFYPLVLEWVRDRHLTVMGDTDVHGSVTDTHLTATVTHRPMTLVFAKDRTEAGIREALFAGRTAVWFNDMVAGREDILTELVTSVLQVERTYFENEKQLYFEIANTSDIPVFLTGGPAGAPAKISIPARTKAWVRLTKPVKGDELIYAVDNYMCGESKYVKTTLKLRPR
ncbi:MAG: hypothetical protein IMZ69_05440 [Spirochaetes bacterium]|nr:hypothetical protein [Spirochaetota bacterium]